VSQTSPLSSSGTLGRWQCAIAPQKFQKDNPSAHARLHSLTQPLRRDIPKIKRLSYSKHRYGWTRSCMERPSSGFEAFLNFSKINLDTRKTFRKRSPLAFRTRRSWVWWRGASTVPSRRALPRHLCFRAETQVPGCAEGSVTGSVSFRDKIAAHTHRETCAPRFLAAHRFWTLQLSNGTWPAAVVHCSGF
jgi:hypothetical protein